MSRAMRLAFASTAAVALLGMSGCGVTVTGAEVFEQARKIDFAFKAEVAEAQLQVWDGDWQVIEYGDGPRSCGNDSYEFNMTRRTPEGWHLDGTPMEVADRVATWLDENGWTGVKARGYSGEIADVVVEAKYPAKHVDLLIIDISPGELFDSVAVYATSTCEPGDAHQISEMRRPGKGEREKLPATEHPTDKPSFGHTEDGKRRFWDDEE
ncbi:hypothetical protein [Microbacterium sp. NPDC087665]|uniref:hypothetical protein n=1 Tax=Microbacterium sp. NPDC087665 TaxID=3364194 RepID=UPI0037F420C1